MNRLTFTLGLYDTMVSDLVKKTCTTDIVGILRCVGLYDTMVSYLVKKTCKSCTTDIVGILRCVGLYDTMVSDLGCVYHHFSGVETTFETTFRVICEMINAKLF